LTGQAAALKERIARLLEAPCADSAQAHVGSPIFALLSMSMLALGLGLIFGERVVRALLLIAI
jgi:hypothetical protein